MAFDPALIINSEEGSKGGYDKSGNFYVNNIITGRRTIYSGGGGKVGAVAGWTVGAADDLFLATLSQLKQSSSTLIIPIGGLKIGDTITGFALTGQMDSAGNTVSVDADLRKMVSSAAGNTDSSVGAITQVSATADTALNSTTAGKTGLSEVIDEGDNYYVKITGITGATTDIEIQGLVVTTNWSV